MLLFEQLWFAVGNSYFIHLRHQFCMLLDQKRPLAGNCRTPCDDKLANENARLAKNPVILKKNNGKFFVPFFRGCFTLMSRLSIPAVAQVILLCACVNFWPRRALLFVHVTSVNPLSRNIRIHAYVLCFEWSLSFRTSHKTLIHTVSGFCVHPYGGPPKEGIHAILWKDNCNEKRLQLDLSMLRGQ